jgi:cell wall assembly regulator SMI1
MYKNPIMKFQFSLISHLDGYFFAALLALSPSIASAAEPDFMASGVIEALKTPTGNVQYGARQYRDTYNLGTTGMRGWIYDGSSDANSRDLGLSTDLSRKILVTTVGLRTPADGILKIDDVILGVSAGNNDILPFSSDARKSFGLALGEAEKTGNGGRLNVKYWRAGVTATAQLQLEVMGSYTASAPFEVTKSMTILNNARKKLLNDLVADPNFPNIPFRSFAGAVNGLALLSLFPPSDPKYSTDPDWLKVKIRLKSYAEGLSPAILIPDSCDTWSWAYVNIFLSEYYLRTVEDGAPNATVLAGLNKYTVALAAAQSRYGTFGHGGPALAPDGILPGIVPPYGALNCAGIAANLSIVLGKKAMLAAGKVPDEKIISAIDRANKFFGYYVNKGMIPYGEHAPEIKAHSLNGKDQLCAVFFSLQGNHQPEAEYFSRISIAAYGGREEGHNGTGFNYLWEGMGVNVAGPLAVSKYFEKIRWNLDLQRRSDGSFTYDGQETAAFAGSSTGDGSYLGLSQYYGMNPTAYYALTYSLPLKSLYITGKIATNATAATPLSPAIVDNAIAAGSFQLDCIKATNETLIEKLSEYDPVVRETAAKELRARMISKPLTQIQINSLVASISNGTLSSNVNTRIGACTALGLLKATPTTTLPALTQRLSDTDLWVRAKAATALASFADSASGQIDTILRTYTQNAATNPRVIDWDDPIQISNGFLSQSIFGSLHNSIIASPKSLLYPAIKIALKQPDSNQRSAPAQFASTYLTYDDAMALTADLAECVGTNAPANTMFSMWSRIQAVNALEKHKIPEGAQAALSMLTQQAGFGWAPQHLLYGGLNALASYGQFATPQLPALRATADAWAQSSSSLFLGARPQLLQTIKIIESGISYNFNSGTLQGWNNRVWNGSVWIDLAANATTYSSIVPSSSTNNLFGVEGGAVSPQGGNADQHLNTLWLRSPQFYLNGSMDLKVELSRGISNTSIAPKDDLSVPFAAINGGGWKGVALRRVSDGVFVLTGARTGGNGDNYRAVIFTQAELATLDQSAAYTLDLINSDYGNWGWLSMDNVIIPGSITPPSALINYNFDMGTLEGWNNRVWNGNAWTDLPPNATIYSRSLLPESPDNGLFAPRHGAVWVNGNTDYHRNTLWLRSPKFYLNGSGDLTVQLAKGIANTAPAPASDLSVPYAAANGSGWKGVALRRVSDGVFVLTKARTGSNDDNYRTVTFSKTELATLDQSEAYTLELINSDYGNWGWLTMDNVSIPGSVTPTIRTISYNFDDNSLQGWNNRVWNGNGWMDLAPNASTYSGTLQPASADNGLFAPGYGAVWVNGNTDNHRNTLWLRSPKFYLNGSGDLTVQLAKGIANTTTAPASDLSVPYAAANGGGWKGVALRRVSDGVFVLTKARTGINGDNYRTVTFTKAELATLNQSTSYTLELINSDRGDWGWLTMDNVSIPGSVTPTVTALAYDFDMGTLEGWNNRVWNSNGWMDLAPNASTYSGTLQPASADNGLFAPGYNAVWVNGNTDYHLNTLWLRSPQFNLNGSGDLTVYLSKGIANGPAPTKSSDVPFTAANGLNRTGWKGVALRRVSDDVFVLTKARIGNNGDDYRQVTFSQAELASVIASNPGASYTLELINSEKGSWGWITMDYVSIPGYLTPTSQVFAASSAVSVASRFAVVTSNSSALPLLLPWVASNIGGSQLSGTSTYNAGTISQSGSGVLGTTSDKLSFNYQTLTGDGEITAKISALQDTGTLSGVGVMIRETLATNSKHVFMGMTGSNTYVTANRITTGGIAATGTAGTGTVPNTWVKLVRVGNVITASRSIDGSTWKTVGSTTVTMAVNSYIGLAVSSGSDVVRNNSQFTNLSVTP